MKAVGRSLLLGVSIALVAAGCGDDDGQTTSAPPTTVGSTTTAGSSTTTQASTTTQPSTTAATDEVFASGEYRFQMSYPADWTEERDSFGTVVIFLSPLSGDDDFSENVNVVVEDLGGASLTVEEYIDATRTQLSAFITDFELYDDHADTLDEVSAWTIAYTGSQGGFDLEWMQTIALHDGNAFVITYTGAEDFEFFLPVAAAIFESFEFLD